MYCKTKNTNLIMTVLLTVLLFSIYGVSAVIAGPPWEQIQKLIAADAKAGDQFGKSVAVSGQLAVIGMPLDSVNGTDSGSAYVFDVTTGQQLFKLLPDDGAASNSFGISCAISGNIAVIGAKGGEGNIPFSGAAYIFDVTTGRQLLKLIASDGDIKDNFGFSVALSGNRTIIGAPFTNDNGFASGSAYVFDVTTGQQLFKLLAGDGMRFDQFGISVSMDGNVAVIGAQFGDGNVEDTGSAYLFDVNSGEQLHKLFAVDGADSDNFGNSVDIDGNLAVIGADLDNSNGIQAGSAYVFDVTTGQQLFKLHPQRERETARDLFGLSVAVSGNIAIVAALIDNDRGQRKGSAYVFDATNGQQLQKLFAADGQIDDEFGSYVAIDGDMTVIGALFGDGQVIDSGSAYVFQLLDIIDLLSITPDPLIARQNGTFSLFQTLPTTQTWLIYSLDGLHQTYLHLLNTTIDLANPKIAVGPKGTNMNGDRQIILPIPNVDNPTDIWFQAVQQENTTNFVATQIIP